ncbi:MAG: MarR family transcriptional regulator [Gemmatimonadaceae bacterium]|nr:MarR family transcriptional regulator [Gemmatimonadaceae bacterium]
MAKHLVEEIKQTKPFERPSDEALLSIVRTASVLEHATNELLRPFGLTTTQYNVLRILRGAGAAGLCGKEIGERMVSRVPDVSRLLDRMESMELIGKERDATDRRHITARLTLKGRRLLEEATTPEFIAFGRDRMARLSARTIEAVNEALAVIRETP